MKQKNFPADSERQESPALAALDFVALLLIVVASILIIFLSDQRTLAGYGTETDFIASMVSEATRLENGTPLQSEFHPPGFIFVMAAVHKATGDWFVTGKIISAVSAMATLLFAWLQCRILVGRVFALGAVAGLISSFTFLKYSVQATSDVYTLSLFFLTYLVAVLATTRGSNVAWFLTGALVVLSLMTRTNGITLVLLLAIPLLVPYKGRRSLAVLSGLLGVASATIGFVLFAQITGSNLMPKGTSYNIAMTYFTDERVSWEGMTEARTRFNSLYDVLTYDPAALAKGYAKDLFDIAFREIPFLAGPMMALLFLPGIFFAAGDSHRRLLLVILAVTVAQLLLVNLKAYEARYHLYMTPWIGAGAVFMIARFSQEREWHRLYRIPVVLVLSGLVLLGLFKSVHEARRFVADGGNPEIAQALLETRNILGPNDVVVSRKMHLAYYTGSVSLYLPDVDGEAALRNVFEEVVREGKAQDIYIFIGDEERKHRPEIAALVSSGLTWLKPVAIGQRGWGLYRYVPSG